MARYNRQTVDPQRWRVAAYAALPDLAVRVFALRGKMYTGCGFHYAMERSLAKCLSDLQPDRSGTDWENTMITSVILEELFKEVRAAEQSSYEWDYKRRKERGEV